MFKLYPWNVLLWAVGPTFVARRFARQEIEEKVDKMWKVHQSRLAQGLGKTADHPGHQNKKRGQSNMYHITVPLSVNFLMTGEIDHQYLDNPFTRMHQSVQNYPHQLQDWDDVPLYQ